MGVRNGKYIEWVDGLPRPRYAEPYTREQVAALQSVALALPYELICDHEGVPLPEELRFQGMSNGEVGSIRLVEAFARGDLDAGKYVLDRQLGKPKQQVESLSMTMTYKDFLLQVAESDARQLEQNKEKYLVTVQTSDVLAGL
jgi:hypothetical protein